MSVSLHLLLHSRAIDLRNFNVPGTEIDQRKAVPYASAVGSLQYAQMCTRPDLAFVTRILGRYQSNSEQAHWIMIKKLCAMCKAQKASC